MTLKEKQIISIIAAVAILAGGFVWASKYRKAPEPLIHPQTQTQNPDSTPSATAGWKTFENAEFTFQYPNKLNLSEKDQQVLLSHSVQYQNNGGCDMKGEGKIYPKLADFNVSFEVINKSLANTVRTISPYISKENFDGDNLKISPGYIDEYELGTKKGVSIYEGVEGCGHVVYYLPVSENKTFVVQKELVQILSQVATKEIRDGALKVPGVIRPEDSEKYFSQILSTFKFTK